MGQSCSILNRKNIENNSLLLELFGKDTIPLGEPFWNQFLSFQADVLVTRTIHKALWVAVEQKFSGLMMDNYKSGNIVNLIAVFIQYSKEIISMHQAGDAEGCGEILIRQTRNALLVIRFIIQSMISSKNCANGGLLLLEVECLPQPDQVLSANETNESFCVIDEFVMQLLRLLLSVPVGDMSLELHMEILLTFFVLLSCHINTSIDGGAVGSNAISKKETFLRGIRQYSKELTQYLVENIANCHVTPKTIFQNTWAIADDRPKSIMVTSVGWLRSFFGQNDLKDEESDDDGAPNKEKSHVIYTSKADLTYALANHSLLFCIMLACSDFSYLDNNEASNWTNNPFLHALSSFTDSEIQIQISSALPSNPAFRIPVSSICVTLSNSLSESVCLRRRPSLVFLYLLLHRNSSFKACALSRTDMDRMVVPLLRILYSYTSFNNAQENSNHSNKQPEHSESSFQTPMGSRFSATPWQRDHAYLALICLLIFTEDDAFCRFANEITLNHKALLAFYADHGDASALGANPNLASLTLLVFLRAIRRNLLIGRDHYLHTSCLAALANLAAHSTEMHAAVASRLVDLLVALARRRVRLQAVLTSGVASSGPIEDTEAALSATDDTARLLLEAINAALTARGRGPAANAHLVISLLREQGTIISAFRSVPNFQDLLLNIQFTMEYFTTHLEKECSPPPTPTATVSHSSKAASTDTNTLQFTLTSVGDVLKVVKTAGSHFPVTRLRKMPDLKFHYVEESSASSQFFLPYALALYQRYSFVYLPNQATNPA